MLTLLFNQSQRLSRTGTDTATAGDALARATIRTRTTTDTAPANDVPSVTITRNRAQSDSTANNASAYNTDFEQGLTGWSITNAGTMTTTLETSQRRSGTQSVRMIHTDQSNDFVTQNMAGVAVPGQPVRVSAWAKLINFIYTGWDPGVYIQGAAGSDVSTYLDATQVGRWVEHVYTFTAEPTAGGQINIYLCCRGDIIWDEVRITTPFGVDTANATVVSGVTSFTRTASDVLPTLNDGASRGRLAAVRGPTDTATASDTLTRQSSRTRTGPAETASSSDSTARKLTALRGLVDVAASGDVPTRKVTAPRTPADTAGAADVLTFTGGNSRSGIDTASATDAATRSSIVSRGLLDTLPTLIETATRGQLGAIRGPTDTAHGTDAVTRTSALIRTGTDTQIAIFEVLSSVGKHFRNMAENPTQAVTDNFGRSGGLFNRNPSDLAGAADTQLIPGQTLYRTDNVEDIPTVEDLVSPSTHSRTNFLGDSAPATDVAMSYGGNVRFGYDEAGGRTDLVDSYRLLTGTLALTRPVTATFTPRGAGAVVWHRSTADSASYKSDTASRPPFARVRTATDNIPLQGESNVKPVYHAFVLSGDETWQFQGDVGTAQYRLKRTGTDPIPLGSDQAVWHQVKVGAVTLNQPVTVAFTQPRISLQNRSGSENLRAQFAETLFRTLRFVRSPMDYGANSATPRLRNTLLGRPVQPPFSRVLFLGITDTVTFDKRNGRLGVETLPVPADVMTTRRMVGTRVVNDFVTGLTDTVVRNTPPRFRDGTDVAGATDALVAFRVKARGMADTAGAIDGYSSYATHPRPVSETLPSTADANASQRLLFRTPRDLVVPNLLGLGRQLDGTQWTYGGSTFLAAGVAAPDGTPSAWRFTFNTGQTYVSSQTAALGLFAPGTTYTFSVWLRSPQTRVIRVSSEDFGDSGTTGGGYLSYTIGPAWTRCSVTLTTGTAPSVNFLLYQFSSDNDLTNAPIEVWRPTVLPGAAAEIFDVARRSLLNQRVLADTASASDTVKVNRIGRTGTDTYPTSDAATATTLHQINRTGTDLVINGSDVVASQVQVFRAVTETAPVTDGGSTRQDRLTRSFAETVAVVSDAATRAALALARTGFDIGLAAPSDAVARLVRPTRVVTDTATGADVPTSFAAHFRSFAEAVYSGESLSSGARQFPRTATDAAPAADLPATRTLNLTPRTAADTASSSDAPARTFRPQRVVTDIAPANDTPGKQRASFLTGTDTAPASDVVARQRRVPVAVADITVVSEAVARQVLFVRAVSDIVFGSDDTQRPSQVYFRPAGPDSAPASEFAAASFHGFPRTTTDNALYTGDLAVRSAATKNRTAAESVPVTDLAARGALHTGRTAADTVPVPVDVSGRQWGAFLRTGDETIPTVSEGDIPPGHRAFAALSDAVTGTASVLRVIQTFRTAVDTVPVVFDSTVAPQYLSRPVVETLPAVNAVLTRLYRSVRNPAETIPTTETLSRSAGAFWRYPVDVVVLPTADTALAARNLGRAAVETIPLGSQAATRGGSRFGRIGTDILSAPFDSGTPQSPRNRSLLESAPATDALSRSGRSYRYGIDAVPVTDLISRTNQGTARSASDSAHFSFETLYSNAVAIRTPIEVATAADSPFRLLVLTRFAAESALFTGDQADRSGRFSSLLTDTIISGDVGGRTLRAARSAADVAASSATGIGIRLYRRGGSETAAVTDLLAVRRFLRRNGIDVQALADFAYRLLDHVRYGLDVGPAIDRGTGFRSRTVYLIDVAAAADTAGRKAFKTRYGRDVLGSVYFPLDVDQTARTYRGVRSRSETAGATDQVRRIWQYIAATTDFAPTSDSYSRKAYKLRYGFDSVGSGSGASRTFRGIRADGQAAHAVDSLRRDTRRGRSLNEILHFGELLDSSRVRPPKPYGPPEVTLTSVSRQRLSLESGRNLSVATFEFDRPVDAWVVRTRSSNAFDGTLLDSWAGAETYTGLAMIDGLLLRSGRNEIAVYGRSATSGEWTRPAIPDLATV